MRLLSIAIVIFLFGSFPVQALSYDEIVTKAESYLNNLYTVRARFSQYADWEGKETLDGDFYLKRPGKLRFDYDAPIKDFIVADGTFIFYYDGELEQQSHAPIGATLADFFLRDQIRLSGDVTIDQLTQTEDQYQLTLIQTKEPEAGALTLHFEKEPFELTSWTVRDAQGLFTTIALSNTEYNVSLDKNLFYYLDPKHGKEIDLNQ